MDFKNMKVSIGIVIAIVAQAFGIIWYVAQLDSTVKGLDSSVATIQEQATTVDIAVLQTDINNIKEKIESISIEEFDSSDLEATIDELEDVVDKVKTKQAVIENEIRTIMSDHSGFNEVLKELGKEGYGDNRKYGDYGD